MSMQRREFLRTCRDVLSVATLPALAGGCLLGSSGCAGRQYGHLLAKDDVDMVGSHKAGAAVWNPLVDEAVAKLLGRCDVGTLHAASLGETTLASAQLPPLAPGELPPPLNHPAHAIGHPGLGSPSMTGPAKVCFIALENKSAEELIDFKDQLYERIDAQVNQSTSFRMVSRRMVDAALLETRLRPDSLFLPGNREMFTAALGRQGTPVDFLLYGRITSGTTERNSSSQRDYDLTLEMVNVHTGDYFKENASIRKGYHKSRAGKWWNYGPFQQADG